MPRKQNLFLFYEKQRKFDEKYGLKYIIPNHKMVNSYMNRFVIDEDEQTEVVGVYNVKKFIRSDIDTSLDYYSFPIITREAEKVFRVAQKQADHYKNNNTDNHFIIGRVRWTRTTGVADTFVRPCPRTRSGQGHHKK